MSTDSLPSGLTYAKMLERFPDDAIALLFAAVEADVALRDVVATTERPSPVSRPPAYILSGVRATVAALPAALLQAALIARAHHLALTAGCEPAASGLLGPILCTLSLHGMRLQDDGAALSDAAPTASAVAKKLGDALLATPLIPPINFGLDAE